VNTATTKKTIYLTEDHAAIRDLLCLHPRFRELFSVIGQTGEGSTAIKECLSLKPDLLLLDLSLNDKSGFEVMQRLKAEGSPTRTLVFSSSSDVVTIRRVLELGAQGFVEKAASFAILQEAMSAVAKGAVFLSEASFRKLETIPDEIEGKINYTKKDLEVLELVADGFTNREAANILGISIRTMEGRRKTLMKKLGAKNVSDIVRKAIECGVIEE
jgi:DNA-binding NarL/FixJ family response regulator